MQKRSTEHKNKYFPKLKRVRQKTNDYCGPAVIEMLASFVGVSVNQTKLVELCKMEKRIVKYGSNINDLRKATKKMVPGTIFWYKDKATIADVKKIIENYKYPVGVEWQGVFEEHTDGDDGHYSVVTHIDKNRNKILISDPFKKFAKIDREFKLDFFKKRWWDFNEIRDSKTRKMKQIKDTRMIFVIVPKLETFPEELGMSKR